MLRKEERHIHAPRPCIRQHTSAYVTYADVCSGKKSAISTRREPARCWVAARGCRVAVGGYGALLCGGTLTSAYVSIRQHTSAYVSIRQHTSAYIYKPAHASEVMWWHSFPANMSLYFADKAALTASNFSGETSETTHLYTTSAYVSIRQLTSAYVSIRQHTSAYVSIRSDAHAAYVCCMLTFADVC